MLEKTLNLDSGSEKLHTRENLEYVYWKKHWIWIQTACPELVLFNSSRQIILHTISRIQEFCTYRFLLTDIQHHNAMVNYLRFTHSHHVFPLIQVWGSLWSIGTIPRRSRLGNRLLQGIVPIDHMSGEDLPYHQPWKQSLSQSGYSCFRLGKSSC